MRSVRTFLALAGVAALATACGLVGTTPSWMPERPVVVSDFYDGVLGRSPKLIGIERPLRPMAAARDIVRTTTFADPALRAWAATADQIDVLDYEVVVVHPPHASPPASVLARLGPPDARVPASVATGHVDGRWTFVLDDGTWVLAAMGYVDRVRVLLGRQRPARLPIPGDVAQLVYLARPRHERGPACDADFGEVCAGGRLESLVVATKVDGTHVTHAHYTRPDAADAAQLRVPPGTERIADGPDVYTRERSASR